MAKYIGLSLRQIGSLHCRTNGFFITAQPRLLPRPTSLPGLVSCVCKSTWIKHPVPSHEDDFEQDADRPVKDRHSRYKHRKPTKPDLPYLEETNDEHMSNMNFDLMKVLNDMPYTDHYKDKRRSGAGYNASWSDDQQTKKSNRMVEQYGINSDMDMVDFGEENNTQYRRASDFGEHRKTGYREKRPFGGDRGNTMNTGYRQKGDFGEQRNTMNTGYRQKGDFGEQRDTRYRETGEFGEHRHSKSWEKGEYVRRTAKYDPGRRQERRTSDAEEHRSRPVKRTNHLAAAFEELISGGEVKGLGLDEWEAVGEKISSTNSLGNRWMGQMLDYISVQKSKPGIFELGKSLYDHIAEKEGSTRFIHDICLIQLYVNQYGREKEDIAFQLFDDICSRHEVLDVTSAGKLLESLSKTSRWRECQQLLDMIELSSPPTVAHYSHVVRAAVRESDWNMVFGVLETLRSKGHVPDDSSLMAIIGADKDGINMERLLTTIHENQWIISADVMQAIKSCFQNCEEEYTTQMVQPERSLRCRACGEKYSSLSALTKEEFVEMREAFLEKAVVRDNIFLNTNPAELQNFQDFLKDEGPFDLVVDALNIGYLQGIKSNKARMKLLLSVLQYFTDRNILFIGRQHMQKWDSGILELLQEKAWVFLTNNDSEDDPFMLYAALQGGPHTLFMTQDEMRNHAYALGPELAPKFRIWQRGHQLIPTGVVFLGGTKMQVELKWPDLHETRAQKTRQGWHIPYEDGRERAAFEMTNHWLCVMKGRYHKPTNIRRSRAQHEAEAVSAGLGGEDLEDINPS